MKVLVATFIILGLFSIKISDSAAGNFEVVKLRTGVNHIDLNGDGIDELVIVAERSNNNAHGYTVYSFLMLEAKSSRDHWRLIPFELGETFKDILTSREGADCSLRKIKVYKISENRVFVLLTERQFGEGYVDQSHFSVTIFDIKKNKLGLPGVPSVYFSEKKKFSSSKPYCDADIMFQQENIREFLDD